MIEPPKVEAILSYAVCLTQMLVGWEVAFQKWAALAWEQIACQNSSAGLGEGIKECLNEAVSKRCRKRQLKEILEAINSA